MSLQQINTFGYEIPRVVVDTLFAPPDDTFSVPVSLQTIPFFAIKNGDLWRWNTSSFIWEQITAGGAVTTIYTGDGLLAGNRIVDLNSNTLDFNVSGVSFLSLNPLSGNEQSILRAFNPTGTGNIAKFDGSTTVNTATAIIRAEADGGAAANIQAFAQLGDSTITYSAIQHQFSGDVFIGADKVIPKYALVNVSTTPFNPSQTAGEVILLVDATIGNITIDLPSAANDTMKITIKKIDGTANKVIIDGELLETIDGDLTKEIEFQWTAATLITDGLNWLII